MSFFTSAVKICCPVSHDLNRHLAELEAHDLYEEMVTRRQDEVLAELCDLDDLLFTKQERAALCVNIHVLLNAKAYLSQQSAIAELRELICGAARRTAEHLLDDERRLAAEDAALSKLEMLA